MGGPYSGPYDTQDPNKADEVIDVEAALAYVKFREGMHPDDICKQLGLSRRTFYRRIEKLILAQELPSRRLIQAMEFDILQDLSRLVRARLTAEDEPSNADLARLVGEARQLSRERRALLRVDEDPAGDVGDEFELPEDDWEAGDRCDYAS